MKRRHESETASERQSQPSLRMGQNSMGQNSMDQVYLLRDVEQIYNNCDFASMNADA